MKVYKLAPICGVLLLALAASSCNRLKARDHLNKGVQSYRNAQFQQAIIHFKEAVRLDPSLLNARLYLATAYAQQYVPGGDTADNKKIADEAAFTLPEGSLLYQDTGFQGFALEGTTIFQPKKKPRGAELTADEKAQNRLISRIRVRVEHAIDGVKRYRIVKDQLRVRKDNFRDRAMETCCGLHNFRLNFRPWHYKSDSVKV